MVLTDVVLPTKMLPEVESLHRQVSLHLLEDVTRFLDCLLPLRIMAALNRVLFRAGIGEHHVVMAPVVRNAAELHVAYGN